jgi:acetyl esterase/lipase
MFNKSALFIGIIILFSVHRLCATVIPVTNPNVLSGLSPYNWICRDGFISSSVCGASLTVKFKGTTQVALQVDTDQMIFEAPQRYPILAWSVNGGPVRTHQLAAGEKMILLSSDAQDPVIDLYIKGMSPVEDRFTGDVPPNAVKISGFIVDEDGSAMKVKLPRKIWLTIGDSILSGDGQHPTAAGHETVYKAALPVFDAILQGDYISPVTIPLWTGNVPESAGRPSGENASITFYQPANPNGSAVVICPGGGYGGLVTGPEGHGIAQWLSRHGIAGIILEYRQPRGNYKVPLADVQRAMRLVRSNAAEWKLEPSRIGIIGFSAGGHLASTVATHFDTGDNQADDPVSRISSRPDFAMLIYPVITMGPKTHDGSKKNLLGPDPSEELVSMFSNEKQVTRQTPPTFLAHALDDEVVSPDNSQQFYDALIANKVPARFVKLPSGGHGLNGYTGPMWDEWQAESLKWLASMKIIPPEKIRVEINPKTTGVVISPLLFGHNLEVTRRGIWSGLGAEMIANRKFAAVGNQLPKQWQPIGIEGYVKIDTAVAYAGRQSVRIFVKSDAPAGISQQQEMLSVSQGSHYDVRAWIRTEITRKVQLRLAGKSGEVLLDTTISCRQGDWQLISASFTVAVTQTTCSFDIVSQDIGTYWVGSVSMMTSDAFHGMRRDVIELLKTIKPGILRFPGGCYAEFYSWKDGLLPSDQRPPIINTGLDFLLRNTDDTDTHEIGIDEFIALCREVGCETAITVRLSENTPDDAAAWVEYCNGAASTKWGDIRISRGHARAYNVGWWFVGNELYSFGRGKASGAAGCAEQTRIFAEAMKKADPTIHLVPSTLFGSGDLAESWNLPLLNMLCREAQHLGLEMACFFMPVNEGAIRVDPLSARLDAAGQVFELYKVHQGNRLLKVPCPSGVDLCASITPGGKQIFLTLVNAITGEQTVSFSLAPDSVPRTPIAIVKQLVPRSLDINETVFNIMQKRVRINKAGKFEVKLEPGAIARIEIRRDA